jgi:acetylornithine deacetylase/succinyl-diaminopimelate desuccinylase-like protein
MKINKRFHAFLASLLLVVALATFVTAQTPFSKKNQAVLKTYEKYIDDNTDIHLQEFFELVAMPSISSIPSHKPEVERAAAWIVSKLKAIGMTTAQAMSTNGSPVVYGSWEGAKGKPTVLIYAHYDVQPVKEEEWKYPPFTPTIEDGKIFGRGATDDKCGIMVPIWAVEAMMKKNNNMLPLNVKFIFDGEEENGSPNLRQFIIDNKDLLRADFALNADGLQFSETIPSVWMGLRGTTQLEFSVKTANYDAHSGLFGGKTPNAVKAMSEIISSLYSNDGSVAVAGFYDNVLPITPAEKAMIAKIPYDAANDMRELGSTAEVGDQQYSPLERLWYRPTLEIIGMQGGYTAVEGFSNIIPGNAMARISCRLVNNQSAEEVIQAIVKHINKNCPVGATVTYKFQATSTRPIKFPSDTKAFRYVSDVLTNVYGTPPLQTAVGGSIGPLIDIKEQLGLYPYSFGVQLADEKFHASNEFVRIASLRKGQLLYCNYFLHVAEQERKAK